MKEVFITGGAGFIGSHSVDLCVREGVAVTVYDKKPWNEAVNLHHQKGKITYIEGDIRDISQLKKFIAGHTHVLHLAALVSVPESLEYPLRAHDTNVTGTLHVFEAAREAGVKRVVYASSAAVYGDQKELPIDEDANLAPMSPYGQNKLMNELHAVLYRDVYKQSSMGLRYFNVYGPRQDPSSPYSGVISIFMERIKNEESITLYGDGLATRDFVSVFDVAEANFLALTSKEVGVCNIATGEARSVYSVGKSIESVLNTKATCVYKPARKGDILHSKSSTKQAERLLSFKPTVTFEGGLKKMI